MAARSVSERPAWAWIFVPPRGPLLASARGLGAMSGPERQVERSLQWGIWWSGCPCIRLVPCRLTGHPFSYRLPQSRPTDTEFPSCFVGVGTGAAGPQLLLDGRFPGTVLVALSASSRQNFMLRHAVCF